MGLVLSVTEWFCEHVLPEFFAESRLVVMRKTITDLSLSSSLCSSWILDIPLWDKFVLQYRYVCRSVTLTIPSGLGKSVVRWVITLNIYPPLDLHNSNENLRINLRTCSSRYLLTAIAWLHTLRTPTDTRQLCELGLQFMFYRCNGFLDSTKIQSRCSWCVVYIKLWLWHNRRTANIT